MDFDFDTILEMTVNVVDIDKGPFLLSNLTTAADLTLFAVLIGVLHAFPRRMKTFQESGPDFSPLVSSPLTVESNRQIRSRLQGPAAYPERAQDRRVSEEQQTPAVQHLWYLQTLPRTRW